LIYSQLFGFEKPPGFPNPHLNFTSEFNANYQCKETIAYGFFFFNENKYLLHLSAASVNNHLSNLILNSGPG